MTAESKNLDFSDYPTEFIEANGKYYFLIRDLNLISSGDDIEKAYRELIEKRDELHKQYKEAGVLGEFPSPKGHGVEPVREKTQYGPFVVKTAIASLAVVMVVAGAYSFTIGSVRSDLARLKADMTSNLGGIELLAKVGNEIDRVAGTEISKEREILMRKNIRAIVAKMKPFVEELSPLFSCPASGETPPKQQ